MSGHRTPPALSAQRLLIDLVDCRAASQRGWTADIRTPEIPEFLPRRGEAIHVGLHPTLAGLLDELERVVAVLRAWWPESAVTIRYRGSLAAAREVARRHALDLPQ